jgi:regulator of RNase E activity RraA
MRKDRIALALLAGVLLLGLMAFNGQQVGRTRPLPPDISEQNRIVQELMKSDAGNISDAVDEVTGHRGFMYHDMKPVFKTRVVGPAVTAVLRPVMKNDKTEYPNYNLQILDEAPAGSVIVYVLEDGLEIAGIGNLMATTAKVRGLAGAVIDGGARDTEDIERLGFPVFSRSITPATSVGRLVAVAKQVPVTCAGVLVRPGDYIVADRDGVVVVPLDKVDRVIEVVRQYDDKESKMIPIIKQEKSMLKALAKYNRY